MLWDDVFINGNTKYLRGVNIVQRRSPLNNSAESLMIGGRCVEYAL